MSPRSFRSVTALLALSCVLVACGGDDEASVSTSSTSSATVASPSATSPSTTAATTSPAVDAAPLLVDPPAGASLTPVDVVDDDWFVELWRSDTTAGVSHLGVGVAPVPASVIDPDSSIARNQALAAAHGVAADLYGDAGPGDVVTAASVTVLPGHPAEHVRLRFDAPSPPVVVDLIALELNGDVTFAAAVVEQPDSAQALFDAVSAARVVSTG